MADENRIDVPDIPGVGGVLSVYVEYDESKGEKFLRATWREIAAAMKRGWIVNVAEVSATEDSIWTVTMVSTEGGYSVVLSNLSLFGSDDPDSQPGDEWSPSSDEALVGSAIVGTAEAGD